MCYKMKLKIDKIQGKMEEKHSGNRRVYDYLKSLRRIDKRFDDMGKKILEYELNKAEQKSDERLGLYKRLRDNELISSEHQGFINALEVLVSARKGIDHKLR